MEIDSRYWDLSKRLLPEIGRNKNNGPPFHLAVVQVVCHTDANVQLSRPSTFLVLCWLRSPRFLS